jgi:hypothetical protein
MDHRLATWKRLSLQQTRPTLPKDEATKAREDLDAKKHMKLEQRLRAVVLRLLSQS